jgi:beta-glucosidase
MDLNDVPASGNLHLLQNLLRSQLGFKGFVVSDAFAVGNLVPQGFAQDATDAALRGATAGVNMDMGSATYLDHMKSLLIQGKLAPAQLDDLVRPILAAKYHLGLFDHPYADATDQTHAEMLAKHRKAARTAATRSVVLLRNEGGLLPLAKTTKRIAVIGPLGNSPGDMNGPWSLTAKAEDSVSVFEGIRAKLPGSQVAYAEGVQIAKAFPSSFDGLIGPKVETPWTPEEEDRQMKNALQLAGNSDVVIMPLGELTIMDFEYSSRSSLTLPGKQQELLEKIQALGKPVVLLLFSTRPLDLSWASQNIPAIMDCYFGGTETGNAVADLLVGDAVPGGKLPVTWPRNVGQVPIYYAHTTSHKPYDSPDFTSRYWDLPTSPLYPLWLRAKLFDLLYLRPSPQRAILTARWLNHGDGHSCEYRCKSSGRSGAAVSASTIRFGIETCSRVERLPPCRTAAGSKTRDQLHGRPRGAKLLECREERMGCRTFRVRCMGRQQFRIHTA